MSLSPARTSVKRSSSLIDSCLLPDIGPLPTVSSYNPSLNFKTVRDIITAHLFYLTCFCLPVLAVVTPTLRRYFAPALVLYYVYCYIDSPETRLGRPWKFFSESFPVFVGGRKWHGLSLHVPQSLSFRRRGGEDGGENKIGENGCVRGTQCNDTKSGGNESHKDANDTERLITCESREGVELSRVNVNAKSSTCNGGKDQTMAESTTTVDGARLSEMSRTGTQSHTGTPSEVSLPQFNEVISNRASTSDAPPGLVSGLDSTTPDPGRTSRGPSPPPVQVVIGLHPHGMLCDYRVLFDGLIDSYLNITEWRVLCASILFKLPLIRELALWTHCVDAGKETAERCIEAGYSLLLTPGGIQEQLLTTYGREKVFIRKRDGFVRLAVQHSIPIVPCYVFGVNDLHYTSDILLSLRQTVASLLRVCIIVAWGAFGLVGAPRCMRLVFGEPIKIDEMYALWCSTLTNEDEEKENSINNINIFNNKKNGDENNEDGSPTSCGTDTNKVNDDICPTEGGESDIMGEGGVEDSCDTTTNRGSGVSPLSMQREVSLRNGVDGEVLQQMKDSMGLTEKTAAREENNKANDKECVSRNNEVSVSDYKKGKNEEFVKFVHAHYIKELQNLFESNKVRMGYADRTLEIY